MWRTMCEHLCIYCSRIYIRQFSPTNLGILLYVCVAKSFEFNHHIRWVGVLYGMIRILYYSLTHKRFLSHRERQRNLYISFSLTHYFACAHACNRHFKSDYQFTIYTSILCICGANVVLLI